MKLDLPTRRGVLRNWGCLLGGALLLPSSLPKALWGEAHQAAKRVSDVMKTLSDYMAGALRPGLVPASGHHRFGVRVAEFLPTATAASRRPNVLSFYIESPERRRIP
jgi:hypothetical protein